MSLDKVEPLLTRALADLDAAGRRKGAERVIVGVKPAHGDVGPRYLLEGCGNRQFLRMNSNAYLGLSRHPQVIEAETRASNAFGTGPGAVRFIGGTYQPHVELERKLAGFHGRDSAMLMSAAYATVMGVLPQVITDRTVVISDALNHNCIINAIRLARPAMKAVYPHLDLAELETSIKTHAGQAARAIVVTDGIFSMRGDHAPLDRIAEICRRHDARYPDGILTVVDDSHGVGGFGRTGRGTEEHTGARADVLIGTLGKAFGVNGGYVVSNSTVISYLRETAPFYVYSNPITPGEAAAALAAVEIVDSPAGIERLNHLRSLAGRLRAGLADLGLETIPGEHPIVPLLIRNARQTSALVQRLFEHDILVTGLTYPVVPKGEDEIRMQVSADQTSGDIERVLSVLRDVQKPQGVDAR